MVEKKYSKYYKSDMLYASGFHVEIDYQPINRNPQQLKAFEQDVISWNHKIKYEEDFPKNCDSCTDYGGCEYWNSVCH